MAIQAQPDAPEQAPASVEVRPLSIHIGAEIGGVDLTRPLPPAQVRDIRAALLKWKVVFFRDQPMTHRQHVDFTRQFGAVTPGHVVYGSDGEYPEIYPISKHRTANSFKDQVLQRAWTGWHTDITAAIKLAPNNSQAWLADAGLLYDRRSWEEAVAAYDKSIALGTDDPDAYMERAYVLYYLGKNQRAVDSFSRAIKLNPKYQAAFVGRALARQVLGQSKEALADFDKAIELKKNQTMPYFLRGQLHQAMGDLPRAIADFD